MAGSSGRDTDTGVASARADPIVNGRGGAWQALQLYAQQQSKARAAASRHRWKQIRFVPQAARPAAGARAHRASLETVPLNTVVT